MVVLVLRPETTIKILDTKKSGFQMNLDSGHPVFRWLFYSTLDLVSSESCLHIFFSMPVRKVSILKVL